MYILWAPLILIIFFYVSVKEGGKENYHIFFNASALFVLPKKLSSQSKYDPEEQFLTEKYVTALLFIEIFKKWFWLAEICVVNVK